MTNQNAFQQSLLSDSIRKNALTGAALAPLFYGAFLFITTVIEGNEIRWGLWIIVHLFTMTVGGAFGGIFYFLMNYFRYQGGSKKILANVVSGLVYLVIQYLSLVASLNLTGHWD